MPIHERGPKGQTPPVTTLSRDQEGAVPCQRLDRFYRFCEEWLGLGRHGSVTFWIAGCLPGGAGPGWLLLLLLLLLLLCQSHGQWGRKLDTGFLSKHDESEGNIG